VEPASRKFIAGNKAICEMLGYTLDELVHLRVDLIHPEEDKARILEQFKRLASEETTFAADIPVQRKDGTVFYADIVASPMIIGEQRFQIGVFRDVSQRREVEARLRQSQKLEAIGTLAGGIAHDFNNILAAILGFGELALDAARGSSIQDDLEQVIKAGKRARELIRQILAISRQSTLESSPQLIQVIAKEVVKLLRATIPATIEIRQDICSDCEPVLADPTQIHQILMNLCTNAFHAMEQTGGILEIGLRQIELDSSDDFSMFELAPGRYVRLDVIDSGCGMEQEIIEHIFEPYYTTKPQGKGSGLGLAVVHGIVESHGGKIICRSEPGQGSTFSVVLPVAEKPPAASQEAQQEIQGGNERILLVDDEESLALLGKKNLESLGYRVIPVTSSLVAMQRFRDNPRDFDLVITDQAMPHLAGENLARKILEIRPDMPVILCTGHSSVNNEELAKSLGIKAFLLKPIAKKKLAESVRMVLDGAER
jgi:PAS domain S-box-containing protein